MNRQLFLVVVVVIVAVVFVTVVVIVVIIVVVVVVVEVEIALFIDVVKADVDGVVIFVLKEKLVDVVVWLYANLIIKSNSIEYVKIFFIFKKNCFL